MTKKDWEFFQERIGQWQENHMEQLLEKYRFQTADKSVPASKRFWNLEREMKRDKQSVGVQCRLSKGEVFYQLLELLRTDVISWRDLHGFSDKLKEDLLDCFVKEDERYLDPLAGRITYEPEEGDELYGGGFFTFDITPLLKEIESGKYNPLKRISQIRRIDPNAADPSKYNEVYVKKADLQRPLIMLEIVPDALSFFPEMDPEDYVGRGYVLADGNHRIAKARLSGIDKLPVYLIPMERHIDYLCGHYQEYANYWNRKLEDRIQDSL